FCLVLIVAPTAQPDALDRCLPAESHRLHVVIFEQPTPRTASPFVTNECALAAVTLPDRASDVGGYAAIPRRSRPGSAGLIAGPELALLGLRDQGIESPVEDDGGIPGRQRVTE